jgi:hypothetical protein
MWLLALIETFLTLTKYAEAGLLNKSSCLAPVEGVTNVMFVTDMLCYLS